MPVYVAKFGDTLEEIASLFDTTVEAMVRANGVRDSAHVFPGRLLYVPEEADGPARPTQVYVTRPGDTLEGIAARFRVSARGVARANGLVPTDPIFVDQVLCFPVPPSPRV